MSYILLAEPPPPNAVAMEVIDAIETDWLTSKLMPLDALWMFTASSDNGYGKAMMSYKASLVLFLDAETLLFTS